MPDMKVVYRFTRYTIDTDEEPTSRRYATLDCIERTIQAAPVKDSLRPVRADYVDARGFYIGPPFPADRP